MRLNLKLHFSFEMTDEEGQVLRQDRVDRDLNFENTEPAENFIARLESFFQELLFAYVPGYPFHKTLTVNRLEAKSDDLLSIEYQAGLLSPNDQDKIGKELNVLGFSRWIFIPLHPASRSELKFTAIKKGEEPKGEEPVESET